MDSNFVDLDIMLTRIREPRSRTYFLDAVKAYKAGALRAALSSAWVAVVYDLIMKYRELSTLGDGAATTFLHTWDEATTNNNVKKLLKLETELINDATTKTQLLNRTDEVQLNRFRDDRHLCAHPAFSTEADLFEPSPEMVRLHLVNAIDLVLSRAPLQGRAIFEQFGKDVQSTGFPADRPKIQDYVEQRYLAQTRPQNVRNFGIVLAKSLLKGTPPEWEDSRQKIVDSLVTVRDRASGAWPDVSASIVRIMNSLEPTDRPRAVAFLGAFPDFWSQLDAPTQTTLQATVGNLVPTNLTDYRVLAGVRLPEFREPLLNVIAALSLHQLREALSQEMLPELWSRSLEYYKDSGSFRGSENNFRNFIIPFAGRLRSDQIDDLLEAVLENNQNWDASGTPDLLESLLKNTSDADFPSARGRNRFFQFLTSDPSAQGQDEVLPFSWPSRLDLYSGVMELLQSDGWTPPAHRVGDAE